MGRFRHLLKNLDRQTRGKEIRIVQKDGTTARFPESALQDAYLRNMDRLRGVDVEPHPLSLAIKNAAQREIWHDSFFDYMEVNEDLEDLSEK